MRVGMTCSVACVSVVVLATVSLGCGPGPGAETPDLPALTGAEGPLSGYVYIVPPPPPPPPPPAAPPAALRQSMGASFIVAVAPNPELGEAAADGTTVTSDSGEVAVTTAGAFEFAALPVGLRTLTVAGLREGVQATEAFADFVVIPETRETPALSVEVRPTSLTKLAVGETLTMEAVLLASGREVADYPATDFTWASGFDQVATVSESGTVTGVSSGQARISATTGGLSSVAAVWVEGTLLVAVGELWSGSVTSYLDNGYMGYSFGTANMVDDPSASRGEADFHMSGLGVIQAWGTGAANLGASVELTPELQPPTAGYITDPLEAAAGEVVVVKRRHGGYVAMRITALVPGRYRRMDFDFIILSAR